MIRTLFHQVRAVRQYGRLPHAARVAHKTDQAGLVGSDAGNERVIHAAVTWLGLAQDQSSTHDGGVARHFSLLDQWGRSYPETTGYIIPTMLAYARRYGSEEAQQRARTMLDWLVSIQRPDGAFAGGVVGARPEVPVTFNTGQILLGLASGVREFGDAYRPAMKAAADWLVRTQGADGSWPRNHTPFALPGVKAYHTHVAWGLLEAARVSSDARYADAALANVRWALTLQQKNGWFSQCCLENHLEPLTHTLGYALRGIVEAYRYTGESVLLATSRMAADGILSALHEDGFLAGRLDQHWSGTVRWACLTGSAQIALCWLFLYQASDDNRYWRAARAVNRFLRRTVDLAGPPDTRGAVRGSFPISGGYCKYEYPNWAAKFLVDSLMLETQIECARSGEAEQRSGQHV